ncbi:MAG: hypothetical protein HC838_09300 [Spirulinaceae cyanobacterium RM2_2_10]|nr:hypothetical protein [Spirulinaceae cyanobacterium RM2_2_10]
MASCAVWGPLASGHPLRIDELYAQALGIERRCHRRLVDGVRGWGNILLG